MYSDWPVISTRKGGVNLCNRPESSDKSYLALRIECALIVGVLAVFNRPRWRRFPTLRFNPSYRR